MATGRGGTGEAYYLVAQAKQTAMLPTVCALRWDPLAFRVF